MARTVVPFGPQHPVLPEPVQLTLTCEDDRVVEVAPVIGYCHRGIEKGAERNGIHQNVFLVERICGICSFIHAQCYCQALEELTGTVPPPRARYLRVVWAELSRIHSHLLWLGLFADGIGFESVFMQLWRIREKVLDLLEATSGQRVIVSTCVIGGVRRDIDAAMARQIIDKMQELREDFDAVVPALAHDYTVKVRTVGKGILSGEQALLLGAVGPTLRGSGIAQDMRLLPYNYTYAELGFEPDTEPDGDSYSRMMVRVKETYTSIDLVTRALQMMPEGDIRVPVEYPPAGEVVMRVEQPRGELFYYVKGNGSPHLERLKVRTPTFANIPTLLVMLPGASLADVPVITLSIDPCISCTER
ncbi:MAG: nickel-dependent hydrogenase large subunit [Clostridia bacterium]|nr:nickel-dependent hydrogenase large subunit [Clostridia bacterium]